MGSISDLSQVDDFKAVVKLTDKQKKDGTAEECVLRFFAFLDRYQTFEHSVRDFLNGYMKDATKAFSFTSREREFRATFAELAKAFPHGIMRHDRKGTTPLNLYEGIAVGAALAIKSNGRLEIRNLSKWMASKELHRHTTGATNDRFRVRGRIEFCRDRFLGIPDVQSAAE
jgi:hypothetical protein